MYRVVIDTVVFVRSLINPYSWWGKILFTKSDEYQLVLSKQIITEILEVLTRPELISKFKNLKGMDTRTLIDQLSRSEHVTVSTIPSVSRDIKDNIFLATAEMGKCAYIISEDKDLLDLKEYNGIIIIKAEEFLELLEN